MADKVKRVDYFTVEMQDHPGEAFKVLVALREHGVNLESVTAFPTAPGKGQLSLVPDQPQKLIDAAKAAGLHIGPAKKALYFEGTDRVGCAAELLKKLADAKINVTAFNAAAARGKCGFILWVKQADVEAAAKALGA